MEAGVVLGAGLPFTPGAKVEPLWFRRSQIRTKESSPPDARVPLRDGDHSIQFIAAACPRSSSKAWPGCRTSKIRMLLESWENVASKC